MRKLPTFEQLENEQIELTELQKLIESEPSPKWIKEHPTARRLNGDPVLYLPIERVDYLLRSIFVSHWWEILSTSIHQNSIQVTGRLLYLSFENGKVMHQDGVGGAMTAQGIETAIAIAESNAKKNAAKKIGKIFGRDLSRDFNEPQKTEQTNSENSEIEVLEQKQEKKVNPVLKAILIQIQKSKSKNQFKVINANIHAKVKESQLDDEEIETITKAVQNKLEELNIKF